MKRTNKSNRIYEKYVKRLLDIILGLFGIIITGIFTIFIYLHNTITKDKESLFYRQKRVGKKGKVFTMYKFRTMYKNADRGLCNVLEDVTKKKHWEKYGKIQNDTRITKIGKFLRKYSIDEIPQFINVLKGDMSCIGPRPLVPGELEKNGGHKRYEDVLPGITSWWGCNGRSLIEYKERFELEYYYIENLSFKLDVKCFFLTIKAIATKEGAM